MFRRLTLAIPIGDAVSDVGAMRALIEVLARKRPTEQNTKTSKGKRDASDLDARMRPRLRKRLGIELLNWRPCRQMV